MRIGIIGYGSVGAIHARRLGAMPGVEAAMWGPDPRRSGFGELDELLAWADGVVVASPSPLHAEHAERAISAGRSVLIELPACTSVAEGMRLGEMAAAAGVLVRGVHASRALPGYVAVQASLRSGALGSIASVTYQRAVATRARSWADDALWHHAQHALDLLRWWFGGGTVVGCRTRPADGPRTGAWLELALDDGATARVEVTYDDGPADGSISIVGSAGSLDTDGFGWLARDGMRLAAWDQTTSYQASIAACDAAFVDALHGASDGAGSADPVPPWFETVAVAALVEAAVAVEERRDA